MTATRPAVYPARDMTAPLGRRPWDAWFATISNRTAEPPLPHTASEEGAGRTRAATAAVSVASRRRPARAKEMTMPMPHRTFAQVAKRRLAGKEGRERIREVSALLAELPDYRNGPYADLRKWLLAEIEDTRVRSSAVHRDSIAVRREGAAQIALVGPPNVGKSSLLQALSEIQIKTGDYPFTTLRPVPALTRIGGVLVQLVEIPGLIGGAADDRGGGRALLGVLRSADAIVYCCRAGGDPATSSQAVRDEVAAGRHRQAGHPRRDPGRRGATTAHRRPPRGSRSRPAGRARSRSSTRRRSTRSATPSGR